MDLDACVHGALEKRAGPAGICVITDVCGAHFRLCLNVSQVTIKCQMQDSKELSLSFYVLFQIRTRDNSLLLYK